MIYFNHCTTLEEVKKHYKKLAMENHPDRGKDTETMQAINREYAFACAKIIKGENLNAEEADEKIRLSEEYMAVINGIIHLPGITIELVGHWIWVTGNTFPVRKLLSEAGLTFARKKKAWYYRPEEFKASRGTKMTLEEIKSKYGSEQITGTGNVEKFLKSSKVEFK